VQTTDAVYAIIYATYAVYAITYAMSNNVLYFLFMQQLGGVVLLCHRATLIALLKYCVQAEGEALVWGFMSLHLRLKSGD